MDLNRFTLSFKSQFGKQVYSHVVLGICCRGIFGAIGMSRRRDLMFKPLESVVSFSIWLQRLFTLFILESLKSNKRLHWRIQRSRPQSSQG